MSGATEAATRAWATLMEGEAAPAPEGDGLVVGRYSLRGLLGQGGGGAVFRAWDRLDREEVAIKLVPAGDPAREAAARRERAALRWLAIPGVVRLRDDGELGRRRFLVMDWVQGEPFPRGPTPWPTLRVLWVDLLRTLRTVHQAGVIHRDLKPANVLINGQGRPVILDFGIARGAALAPADRRRQYTPGYAAPELVRGEDGDARADLFAVGCMVGAALGPDAPAAARRLAERMRASAPSRRLGSAGEALAALAHVDPAAEAPLSLALPERIDGPGSLTGLFLGPEPFFHAQRDPAELLWARTGGDRAALARWIDDWLRLGVARWIDGRLRVDRVALARERGAHGEADALGALERALAEARIAGDARAERAALERWTCEALGAESLHAIERALYEVDRAVGGHHVDLAALIAAGRAALQGEGQRCANLLATLAPFSDEELETCRVVCALHGARALGLAAHASAVEQARVWAGEDPRRRARCASWLGSLRYRQGRYAEAAELYLEALSARDTPRGRVADHLNAAMALIEVPDLGRAEALAEIARSEAALMRHPSFEAMATWLGRTARYRRGDAGAATPEHVDAAQELGPYVECLLAATEAAIAWRAGDLPLAHALASRAARCAHHNQDHDVERLNRALALLTAPGGLDRIAARSLADESARCQIADFEVQVLGLLAMGGLRDLDLRDRAQQRAEARPRARWRERVDVLSYEEVMAAFGAGF